MSISSLPLPMSMPTAPPPSQTISASVTRILTLADFSAELKTRDLQSLFVMFQDDKGGFKIKWIDDVTALVVFADATVAKRAYLYLLANPSPILPPPATVRPYDGPDAQAIIHSVAARSQGHHAGRSSFAGGVSRESFGAQGVFPTGRESFSTGRESFSNGSRVGAGFSISPPMTMTNGVNGFHGRTTSIGQTSGVHQRTGSFNSNTPLVHARASTTNSATPSSWGRHSVSGVLSGFNPPTLPYSAMAPPQTTSRAPALSTLGEMTTPTQESSAGGRFASQAQMYPSGNLYPPRTSASPVYAPTFHRSTSSASNHSTASRDAEGVESPGLELVGTMPVAEGGPAGQAGWRMAKGAMPTMRSGGVSPTAGNALPYGNGNGSINGSESSVRRRESQGSLMGADKALREVEKALEGLGASPVEAH